MYVLHLAARQAVPAHQSSDMACAVFCPGGIPYVIAYRHDVGTVAFNGQVHYGGNLFSVHPWPASGTGKIPEAVYAVLRKPRQPVAHGILAALDPLLAVSGTPTSSSNTNINAMIFLQTWHPFLCAWPLAGCLLLLPCPPCRLRDHHTFRMNPVLAQRLLLVAILTRAFYRDVQFGTWGGGRYR